MLSLQKEFMGNAVNHRNEKQKVKRFAGFRYLLYRSFNARWEALQAGTSHFFKGKFRKKANLMLKFATKEGHRYVWATSMGSFNTD